MFLYAIPSSKSITVENLAELQLDHIIDAKADLIHREVFNGPWGGAGVVFASQRSIVPDTLGYFPNRQEWTRFEPNAGKPFWIGRFTDKPSSVDQLKRPLPLDGREWTDWKGNSWLVPIARKWQDQDELRQVANLTKRSCSKVYSESSIRIRRLTNRSDQVRKSRRTNLTLYEKVSATCEWSWAVWLQAT